MCVCVRVCIDRISPYFVLIHQALFVICFGFVFIAHSHFERAIACENIVAMLRTLFLICASFGLAGAAEHWFVFDQYQFPGFYSALFTLKSSPGSDQDAKYLSFALTTYDRSVTVDVHTRHANGTVKDQEQSIKLNSERADLLYNAINHMIFVAVRENMRLETYVNCKLIDSYLLYSALLADGGRGNASSFFQLDTIADNIEHYEVSPTSGQTQQEIFETFSCKQPAVSAHAEGNPATSIGRPLIRKMQHVIEKVQRRKLRSR